jgi:hypothetical protein
MPRSGWSPKLVPYWADQTVYLVVDSFSASGTVYRETEVERTDFETIIADFLTGQFNDPVRVIAFNTLEHWSDDVSEAIATEIQTRCDIDGVCVPEHVSDFVNRHWRPVRQPALKLARETWDRPGKAPACRINAGSTPRPALRSWPQLRGERMSLAEIG